MAFETQATRPRPGAVWFPYVTDMPSIQSPDVTVMAVMGLVPLLAKASSVNLLLVAVPIVPNGPAHSHCDPEHWFPVAVVRGGGDGGEAGWLYGPQTKVICSTW